ncbi:MAG: hypothetical protein NTY38_02560 [Acidobacteria bacterium]|nr:hypothetical protein [Acidobacteriota bacterium]
MAALLALASSGPAPAVINKALRERFDGACSKWVARDSRGTAYVLQLAGGLSIRAFQGSAGSPNPVAIPVGPVYAAGITIDARDRLHLFWNSPHGAIGYRLLNLKTTRSAADLGDNDRWLDPETGRAGLLSIAASGARLGDIAIDATGSVWLAWTTGGSDRHVRMHLGSMRNRRWQIHSLVTVDEGAPPSLIVDGQDRFHLAWHDVYEDTYYLTGKLSDLADRRDWEARRLVRGARRPVLAAVGGQILAVLETSYSALEYSRADIAQATSSPLTGEDSRFAWDTCHSPEFAIDRYGIPWMFFIDSARQHVFYSRWLGTRWSGISNSQRLMANSPRMEENHLSIDRISVEPRMSLPAEGIGLALSHEGAGARQEFYTIPVPALRATPGKRVLFLDLLELERLDGLTLSLNQARKYEGNPVINVGEAGDFDAERAGNFLRVLKENGVYRMWYAGLRSNPAEPWWDWYRIGYAESRDGRQFRKIPLGLAPFGARSNTNLIPDLPYVPMVAFDASDPDPRRRYKLLKIANHGVQNDEARAGRLDPRRELLSGSAFTSPDGIHWNQAPAEIEFPAGRPFSFIPQSLFHDRRERDAARKYKAYGFTSLNLARRGGAFAYSPDAIHWTAYARNPVLDPFARAIPVVRGGKVHQIHDTVVWQYGDYYLAFYQYQLNGGKLDVEMAVSRDGENFVFVRPGGKLIPRGPAGSWDCDEVTASLPLVDNDEIKLYYGGGCGDRGAGGLSTLRLDGFTNLELEPNRSSGMLATIPIHPEGARRIIVNADCGRDGYLEAELVDAATGSVLPGFSRGDSIRIQGNSTRHALHWRGEKQPGLLLSGEFRLRIYFAAGGNSPRLYAIHFE